jgi:hypothetical protein
MLRVIEKLAGIGLLCIFALSSYVYIKVLFSFSDTDL